MDGIGGYTSSWRIIPVNVHTWQGTESIGGVKSVKVVNKVTDDVPKIQSGSMSVVLPAGERFDPGWYRIEMTGYDTTGSVSRVDVATLLFEQTSGVNDYDVETVSVTGQSVLKPVEDKHMRFGNYINKGDNGALWCLNTLTESTPAPVILEDENGFTVDRYYVFDSGTSCLNAVWKVLDSAGWILQIHGDGSIHILEKPENYSFEIGRDNLRFIKPGISYDEDYSDIPNYYYARLGDTIAEVTNNDPDSPVSVVKRTYVKDVTDMDPIPINGETLDHYVNRMLEESSTVYKTYTYERDFGFDVRVFDNMYWNIPDVHTGKVRLLEQTVNCSQGITFEEQCGEEIKLWQYPR